MTEFRYQRMTQNDFNWKRPHTGRLGVAAGYVSEQGFGHEDWNFAGDLWEDGKHHLYLTSPPKKADLHKSFNLVLGAHTKMGAVVLGFAEDVQFSTSNLSEKIWERRAREVKALDKTGQLGPRYAGKTLKQIVSLLKEEVHIYSAGVAPGNLYVIDKPILIPSDIFVVSTPQYRSLPMHQEQYHVLRKRLTKDSLRSTTDMDDDVSFPEGAQLEKLHRYRERQRSVVMLAKAAFIDKHGSLFCEACGLEPSTHFNCPSLSGKVIEAHHNVPISDPSYTGTTKVADLSMLCPTCHRAIHTIRPWLTVEALAQKLAISH